MSIGAGIAIYGIIWFLVLFAVLPWGVKTHGEAGTVEPGTAESAPVRPLLLRKVLATTLVAFVVWLGVYYMVVHKPVTFDDIPFLPKFEGR